MEAALAELGERYECEVEVDSTELDLEECRKEKSASCDQCATRASLLARGARLLRFLA